MRHILTLVRIGDVRIKIIFLLTKLGDIEIMLIFAMGSWLKLVKYAVKGGIKEQSSRTGVRERREN